ncbi:MAG: hypothetical protein WCJ03_11000 [Bacteroidales bacterium]
MADIKFGKKVFIRNAGKDEYWLQDIIYNNPGLLPLENGKLQIVNKEKKQSSGGRLDILLKEPEENTMYEVELMLGETDPSHIIRSIEYWDNEKRKYPQRQHFSVLIAESFDRRYFNVIQLMSLNIPMIAIQVDLLEVNNEYILNFTKIIDIYVEQEEDNTDVQPVSETTWNSDSSWTNTNAKMLFNYFKEKYSKVNLRYTLNYISINIDNRNAYWFYKRQQPSSALFFAVKDDEKVESIKMLLDDKKIPYSYSKYKEFMLNVDTEFIKSNFELFQEIHDLRFTVKTVDE